MSCKTSNTIGTPIAGGICKAGHSDLGADQAFSVVRAGHKRTRLSSIASSIGTASPSETPSGQSTLSRSEEHTSELQSLMRISYVVFCLKKNKMITYNIQAN